MSNDVDNDEYKESLREFKKSMLGGSEKELFAKIISENSATNRIRWLDVGIGDGKFAEKVKRILESEGFIVEITGIDPCDNAIDKARERLPNANLVVGDYNDTEFEGKFDLVTFNQSVYYFHNKNHVVEKSIDRIAEGGLLVGVVWRCDDAIYKFHKEVFGSWTIGSFTSDDFKRLLENYDEFQKIKGRVFIGEVDFKRWKDGNNLQKNLNVISRIPLSKASDERHFNSAVELIESKKDREPRINEVVCAKKKYDIKDFERSSVVEKLKDRFPEYEDEVGSIRGDAESLFMASWQRETESLADYIPKGRVLEICCAAGLKSVILAKKHEVVGVDINDNRLQSARDNAEIFGVSDNTEFKNVDVENERQLRELILNDEFDAVYVDVDWREDLSDPIKKQNLNPFKTRPDTQKLYKDLRMLIPDKPIIFKVSPFVRVQKLRELDTCVIEELHIDGKFLSYNVYFDPKRISKNRWQEKHLFNIERS